MLPLACQRATARIPSRRQAFPGYRIALLAGVVPGTRGRERPWQLSMSEESHIRYVRALWETIREGGIEAGLERTPGVEWRPHAAGGRVLTSEELLRFFSEFQGERELLEVVPYSYHAQGDHVIASGSFRLRGPGRISEFQIHWVYEFEDDRLQRAASYGTRSEALAAIGVDEL
jgi:hypothetical protein